eukprot:3197088-Pleurochrysis_carterae.AAC.1
MATVVNLRTGAPSAHCAKSGACAANLGHHAMPRASPLSAGFSMAHTAPASCAVCASLAVNSARLLCFAV